MIFQNGDQDRLLVLLGRAWITPIVENIPYCLYSRVVIAGILELNPPPHSSRIVEPQVPPQTAR